MNQADRIKIINFHGTKVFGDFMAVGDQQNTSGSYSGRRGQGHTVREDAVDETTKTASKRILQCNI